MPSFDQMYPMITRWVSQEEGWIELGADHHSPSLARALYGGGMAWEGADDYGSLHEALQAMEEGVTAWIQQNRPASPERSRSRPRSAPKAGKRPEEGKRMKRDAASSVPRTIVEKVRKLTDMAQALRQGKDFSITRLTTLKSRAGAPNFRHFRT